MKELRTALLREKFVIQESSAAPPISVALSNRLPLTMPYREDRAADIVVVRTHNMHTCVRTAAQILRAHNTTGSLFSPGRVFDWETLWNGVAAGYETDFNPGLWGVVYYEGKPVFSTGEHNPLLDMIEECQQRNAEEYEQAICMAEEKISQAGRKVRIDYDANMALTVQLERTQGRIGVIVRGPTKTTTFNFSVAGRDKRDLDYAQCLGAAAAFLEGIQLAFLVGMNEEKLRRGIIARGAGEDKQTQEARHRLTVLNREITMLETVFDVRYRPERPEFQYILSEAETLARDLLG